MDEFSYFHLCDHRIKKPLSAGDIKDITVTNSGKQIDTVINAAIVHEVFEVRVLEGNNDAEIEDFFYDNEKRLQTYDDVDPGDSYYDDKEQFIVDYSKYFKEGNAVSEPLPPSFYEPILHNRLKWLVKPPKRYVVNAKVRYTNEQFYNYYPEDCPICAGKGWFVDILNKEGEFIVPTGIEKVAQRVVKDLLTQVGTQPFDPNYGTTIKEDLMVISGSDEDLFDALRLSVSSVEDQYLSAQQERLEYLSGDETLNALIIENVLRSAKNTNVIILQLRIQTEEEDRTFRLGI